MRKAIWILALLALLAGCTSTSAPDVQSSASASYDTAIVERGDVALKESYQASISMEFVSHTAQLSGVTDVVHVHVGQTVEAGTLLAEIGTAALEKQLEQQREMLAATEARYDVQLQNANFDLAICYAKAEQAGADAEMLKLEEAELLAKISYLTGCKTEETSRTERAIERLQAEIEASRVMAACTGTVAAISLRTGAAVREGDELFRIAKTGSEYLLCSEADSSLARTDARCEAQIGAERYALELIPYTNEELIAAQIAGKAVARFALPEDAPVRAGQAAQLLVFRREAQDALYLPRDAVYERAGFNAGYVYRIVDGEKVYTEVQVAFFTPAWAVIASGVEEGDVIYVPQSS